MRNQFRDSNILLELLLFLFLLPQTLFFYDISAQIQYDTCNSTSNVLNYVCHSPWMSSFWFLFWVCRPQFIIPKGVFIFKNYMFNISWTPRLTRGILYTKKEQVFYLFSFLVSQFERKTNNFYALFYTAW